MKEAAALTPHAGSHHLSGWRLFVVIASLYLGTFVMALDTNIINVAVPKISADFDALEQVAWYGSAYLLTLTACQTAFGTLYKYFDITVVYRSCIFIFEVGSIVTAAATSSPMFIVGRAIAGLGAAGLLQGSLSIIGHAVELQKRPLYMGIVISVFVISVCIGPVIGGALTTNVSWRWCFWINVPIGAVVIVLLFLFLKLKGLDNEDRKLPLSQKLRRIDPVSCVVFIGAVCCLLLALQWGGQSVPWNSSKVWGLFVGSGLLLLLFCILQWKFGEKATIPPRIFRQRSVMAGSGVLFFLGASLYLDSFFIPFWFQAVGGLNAMDSGVRLIPLFLPQMVSLIIFGAVVTRWGHYVPYILLGEMISIVGTVLLTKLELWSSAVFWGAALVITGLGMGLAMQLPYTAIQVALPEADLPIGNAILVFVWQLGGAVAIAIGQNITVNTIVQEVAQAAPGVSLASVLAAGAINLPLVTDTPSVLQALRGIWNLAISRTMIVSLAMVCAAVPFSCGMEWLNAKEIAATRKQEVANFEKQGNENGAEV